MQNQSNLCKPDLAQPVPVSVSMSLSSLCTSVHSAQRSLPRDLNSDPEALQTETIRGFIARLHQNSYPPASLPKGQLTT